MEKSKKQMYKDIEEGGRKWRIGKWSARLANYWTLKILAAMEESRRGPSQETVQPSLADCIGTFSKADFMDLQKDCLSVCSELQNLADSQIAPIPVLRVDGTFNVPDLDYDVMTVMALVMQAIVVSTDGLFTSANDSGESDKQASDSTQSSLQIG